VPGSLPDHRTAEMVLAIVLKRKNLTREDLQVFRYLGKFYMV